MKRRHFEFVEGSSSKFWEVWIDGAEVHTRYGRIGSPGQETTKAEGDAERARKLHDKLVDEKTKKGYVEKRADGANDAGSTDLAPLISRIEAKAKAASVKLNKPATEKALAKVEKTLGFALPDEVRRFYEAHDGSDADAAIEGRELLSLARIASEWRIWKGLLDGGDFEGNDHGKPGPGVQKRWWIAEWVPVTSDGAGNHHVLDLAPAKKGTHGQILSFWHDEPARDVVAKGFLRWLADEAEWGDPDIDEADDEDGEDELDDDFFRRFEKGKDFWSICFDGLLVIVRFGKTGTKGQEQKLKFTLAKDANKEHARLIKEKTSEGYKEVS